MREFALIAAVSENNVIGYKGNIPWNVPEDLKRFKELTSGHPVIMGRKTYESILSRLGHPLSNRWNIVISRDKHFRSMGITGVVGSVEEALDLAGTKPNLPYVIGGEQIYNQTINLPDARKIELTRVKGIYHGDSFFPRIDSSRWVLSSQVNLESCSFQTYVRR
jgi:dihydrofolate reductase